MCSLSVVVVGDVLYCAAPWCCGGVTWSGHHHFVCKPFFPPRSSPAGCWFDGVGWFAEGGWGILLLLFDPPCGGVDFADGLVDGGGLVG